VFNVKQFMEDVSRETMATKTKKLGDLGEKIAEKYLKNKGYKILEKNFRYKNYGEIDIIAQKNKRKLLIFLKPKHLTFVEVKTRKISGNSSYRPEDNITYFKKKQLIKLSKIYLSQNKKFLNIPYQIDVIAIEILQEIIESAHNQRIELRHIEQAITDFK